MPGRSATCRARPEDLRGTVCIRTARRLSVRACLLLLSGLTGDESRHPGHGEGYDAVLRSLRETLSDQARPDRTEVGRTGGQAVRPTSPEELPLSPSSAIARRYPWPNTHRYLSLR